MKRKEDLFTLENGKAYSINKSTRIMGYDYHKMGKSLIYLSDDVLEDESHRVVDELYRTDKGNFFILRTRKRYKPICTKEKVSLFKKVIEFSFSDKPHHIDYEFIVPENNNLIIGWFKHFDDLESVKSIGFDKFNIEEA